MIDVTIVATRRPDLLSTTLESFSRDVFSHLPIATAHVNLDPVFGSRADHAACIALLERYFPKLVLYQPEKPGFGAAVKRVWASTSSDHVLHLEDDWIALQPIGEAEIMAPFADPRVVQVAFSTAEKGWDTRKKGHFHQRRARLCALGINIPLPWFRPIFTTSPSVMRGNFARACAARMNPALDPEKQFYNGVNPALEHHVSQLRNHILSADGAPVIRDIGRTWREERNIRKLVENSVSSWST